MPKWNNSGDLMDGQTDATTKIRPAKATKA